MALKWVKKTEAMFVLGDEEMKFGGDENVQQEFTLI